MPLREPLSLNQEGWDNLQGVVLVGKIMAELRKSGGDAHTRREAAPSDGGGDLDSGDSGQEDVIPNHRVGQRLNHFVPTFWM